MKRYKLLKDLPTFNAGDEFYIDNFGSLRLCKSNIIAYASFTLEKFPNILTDWFEEVHEEYKRWRAEYGGGYAYMADDGLIAFSNDRRGHADNYRYRTGNYARGDAPGLLVEYKEYNIARQVLLDDAEGGKWKKDEMIFYAYYDHDINEWIVDSDVDNIQTIGVIYFQDREKVRKSLKEHEEQWEIVRKYEMGEK